MTQPLLAVRDLVIERGTGARARRIVHGLSFDIAAGETLGLVGASGAGKTLSALALLGLLPAGMRASGSVRWRGRELLGLEHDALRAIRGVEIALIPQDPLTALHPLWRVDRQVAEALRAHRPELSRNVALAHATTLLVRTGIPRAQLDPAGFPFEWSGGMRQRALIAMAVSNRPALLLADEPTTALDVATQSEVLALLRELQRETGMALLLITHDSAVVAALADRVAVLRDGRIETGAARMAESGARADAASSRVPIVATRTPSQPSAEPRLLRVEGLCVDYPRRRGSGSWRGSRPRALRAVDNVSFDVSAGEVFGIVGESGAGKSTLARALLRLETPTAGRILLGTLDLTGASATALRAARARIQIVFQDHAASLSPRRRVGASIAQPLYVHRRYHELGGASYIGALLERVGLPAHYASRLPHELSGGERQRVAIARALALRPELLVLDEPVTSLDADARDGILRLLFELQRDHGLALILIAHDLHLVRGSAHRVAVMHAGRIVESGGTDRVFTSPQHPRTRALLAAVLPRALRVPAVEGSVRSTRSP